MGREKWAERQNKAISERFNQMREHYKGEAEKQSQKVLDYFQGSKLQAEERQIACEKKTHNLGLPSESRTRSCTPKNTQPKQGIGVCIFNPLPSPKGERPNGSLTQWRVAALFFPIGLSGWKCAVLWVLLRT